MMGDGSETEQARKGMGSKRCHQSFTFLHFVTQEEDFIPAFNAAAVPVDATDPQLRRVWGP